jgi:hypothetical protein
MARESYSWLRSTWHGIASDLEYGLGRFGIYLRQIRNEGSTNREWSNSVRHPKPATLASRSPAIDVFSTEHLLIPSAHVQFSYLFNIFEQGRFLSLCSGTQAAL